MADELWGTFSIYDHRDPVFRRALVLFDRVVIPVPDKPIGNLTPEELDGLAADADYLTEHGAAVRYNWDSGVFADWQTDIAKEALSLGSRDAFYDTRLMLQQRSEDVRPEGVEDVMAVPVYGAREGYNAAVAGLEADPQEKLLADIGQRISVPAAGSPLEYIVALRGQPAFRAAMTAFREWHTQVLPEVLTEGSERQVRKAVRDFEGMLSQYEAAVAKARFERTMVWVGSLLAISAQLVPVAEPSLKLMASVASPLIAIAKTRQPIWRELQHKGCAPAAVVYEANRL